MSLEDALYRFRFINLIEQLQKARNKKCTEAMEKDRSEVIKALKNKLKQMVEEL